ncbi:MAG: hypothetical protein II393_01125 [Cytophagales bacterium]|nr:hypothetical protein [Cytophagales bacterium]
MNGRYCIWFCTVLCCSIESFAHGSSCCEQCCGCDKSEKKEEGDNLTGVGELISKNDIKDKTEWLNESGLSKDNVNAVKEENKVRYKSCDYKCSYDFFKDLTASYHEYDSWPEGYFFIDCFNQKDAYYVPSGEWRLYTDLKSYEDKKEVETNGRSILHHCSSIVDKVFGGIYYNGRFSDDVDVCKIVKYLNRITDGNLFPQGRGGLLVNPTSVFFDRDGTFIILSLFEDEVALRITKDKIYVTLARVDRDVHWREVFSEKPDEKVCWYTIKTDVGVPRGNGQGLMGVKFDICLGCGNFRDIVDEKGNPVSLGVILDTISYVVDSYRVGIDYYNDIVNKLPYAEMEKKYYNSETELFTRNMLLGARGKFVHFLFAKQWYDALKKNFKK